MKHTKIVATISDKRCDVEFIRQLFDAGMNVVRLNTAHISTESAIVMIKNVREVSDSIAILVDTKVDKVFKRAAGNLEGIRYLAAEGLNVFDLLKYGHAVVTRSSVETIAARCR